MNLRKSSALCTYSALVVVSIILHAQSATSPSPREQLSQYVTQLQANPSDDALREKIIQLVEQLQPSPVVPREAKEAEGAAEYAFKSAQSPSDFKKAAAEYSKALLIAPWVAGDYYNLGLCWEKAGDSLKAIAAYQLYLLAAPEAKEADDLVKHIGALKYASQQQQEQQAAAQVKNAAAEAQREAASRLEGRYVYHDNFSNRFGSVDTDLVIDIENGQAAMSEIERKATGTYAGDGRVGVTMNVSKVNLTGRYFEYSPNAIWKEHGAIDLDGKTITVEYHCTDGSFPDKTWVYERQY